MIHTHGCRPRRSRAAFGIVTCSSLRRRGRRRLQEWSGLARKTPRTWQRFPGHAGTAYVPSSSICICSPSASATSWTRSRLTPGVHRRLARWICCSGSERRSASCRCVRPAAMRASISRKQDGELAERSDPALSDLAGLERLVAVEILAEDCELALERLDHRIVDARVDARARLAPARGGDRLLEHRPIVYEPDVAGHLERRDRPATVLDEIGRPVVLDQAMGRGVQGTPLPAGVFSTH